MKKTKSQEIMTMSKEQVEALSKVEDIGTAQMRAGTQIILAIEDILQKQFAFTENDLKKMETELKHYLKTLAHLTRENMLVLNSKDMEAVGYIAQKFLLTEKANKSGIALPSQGLADKLLKGTKK